MASAIYNVERKTEGKWEQVFDTKVHQAAYDELERLWTDARTEGVRYWLWHIEGGTPYYFEVRERCVPRGHYTDEEWRSIVADFYGTNESVTSEEGVDHT
jgi:hypothetical protein